MQTQRKALLAAIALTAMQLSTSALAAKEQCLVFNRELQKIEHKLCDVPDKLVDAAVQEASQSGQACALPDPALASSPEPGAPLPAAASPAPPDVLSTVEWRQAQPEGGSPPTYQGFSAGVSASGMGSPATPTTSAVKATRESYAASRPGEWSPSVKRETSSSWTPPDVLKPNPRGKAAWNAFECLLVLAVIATLMAFAVNWSDADDRRRAEARPRTSPPGPPAGGPKASRNTAFQQPVRTLSIPDRKKYGLSWLPAPGSPGGPLARLVSGSSVTPRA
ncbi:hypothetical protein H6P1_00230 (plasmid) [Variovorax sp. PBL-H6]|nr:hypothetical protein H6P1_00230 [Variovorax sp. PBL-H6]VTU43820.1 hypothetical protein SRS16P1_00673 [Variovorax sp. SRS16]VTU43885.1 hypothetical protein E5P1_00666 [Variovorax sp. PBL-E5]